MAGRVGKAKCRPDYRGGLEVLVNGPDRILFGDAVCANHVLVLVGAGQWHVGNAAGIKCSLKRYFNGLRFGGGEAEDVDLNARVLQHARTL